MKEKADNFGRAENLGWIDDELREFQIILETEMEEKLRESVLAEEHTRQRLSLMEEETFRQVEEEWVEKKNILLHREREIRKETALFTESLKGFLADNSDLEMLLEKTWTDLTGGVLS
ncbi:MAG: hypothetical protein GX791_05090 [Synergistaceae bacterium]|nr:hypothetical protein [Synergistaceae bacterium]